MNGVMNALRGKETAENIYDRVRSKVQSLKKAGISPKLGIVRLGERPDDMAYEKSARQKMEQAGIETEVFAFPSDIDTEEFAEEFATVNARDDLHGILLFRPLPSQIDADQIINIISPVKDVDGMCSENMAKVFAGEITGFAPCTAQAVIELMEYNEIKPAGKKVAVVGRSLVIGRPLALLLLRENATVTICHTKTKDLGEICRAADIVVTATGQARKFDTGYFTHHSIVIDVGTNAGPDGRICGDVNFDIVCDRVKAITPVPGGVGTVTTAVLAEHVADAAMRLNGME